ncbi:GNAT family N-acetyltransferase [Amnibacterium sp. CER49]|uniref:GNAT family N-acetyltransferase n=1 Tax=Amnibacterium sp. CER49 TaxID=3039161 RepID=UPI00244BCA72|nr:GNAT family N-acetyltransferase [Amnibacterium sp. CER49]MDH2442887.1 GNAT family N-acetyltransferase [Amnibacterium sp. CER49]
MPSLERVRTDRLLLRRPAEDDAPLVLTLLNDPDGVRHNPSDALHTLEEARDLVRRWQEQWDAGLGYWVVEQDGAGLGVCGVKAVRLADRPVWNLLYRLLPEAQGRGVAREAAAEAVRRAQEVDPGRPVVARVRPANTASARVAAAIGLERRPDLDVEGEDGADEVWATP